MATPARRVGAPADDTTSSDDFVIPGRAADEVTVNPDTVLADIASDLAENKEAGNEPISLVVPNRPNYMLQFRTNIDFDDLRLWIKKAKDGKGDKADTHQLRLAFAVLSNTNVGMTFKGHAARAKDGRPLTLTHPELQGLLGTPIGGTPAAIRKFYGADGHIILTMKRVCEEAGYSDEVDLDADSGPFES